MVLLDYLRAKDENKSFRDLFRDTFGFRPKSLKYYKLAFKHRSVFHKVDENNERLEFLGDAILSSVISELCYATCPDADEGYLTQMRSKIVNREFLNNISLKIGMDKFIEYDKNITRGGVMNDIFGNCLEAFIGAVYLDKGYRFAQKFILRNMVGNHIDIEKVRSSEKNFKGRLYEFAQKDHRQIKFVTEEQQEKNDIIYLAKVLIDGEELGSGKGPRKKKAEQEAARVAYEILAGK